MIRSLKVMKGYIRIAVLCTLALSPLVHGAQQTEAEGALLSQVRQLTFEGKRAGEGYFSADGRRMIFQSERDERNPFYQIYLMDLETGDVDQISPGYGKTTCAWIHPDNQRVLYASTHDDQSAREKMEAELNFRA
ncbi:MAG: hypothetical protein MI754_01480, partial [Chromatiales bacterium]|nr:hypothetical protein [Chromatiales bacterium]